MLTRGSHQVSHKIFMADVVDEVILGTDIMSACGFIGGDLIESESLVLDAEMR